MAILKGVQTQPLFTRCDEDPEVLLDRLLELCLGEASQSLRPRGVDLDIAQAPRFRKWLQAHYALKERMYRGVI